MVSNIIPNQTSLSEMNKSRNYLILEGITGIGQFSLTTGAFLAGFVSFLGGSETVNGMLGVIPAAMGILQIFSSQILRKSSSRKHISIRLAMALRLFLSSIYFIPYILMNLGASSQVMLLGFIICFSLAYAANSLLSPMISGWIIDVTPLHIRGKYLANRDRISLVSVAICTIILGRVLDYNKVNGNEFIGFVIVGLVLVIFGILNIYALHKTIDVTIVEPFKKQTIKNQLLEPLNDHIFKKVIYLYILWNFGLFIGAPYIAVYMVERLHLSYTYMMAMTVLGTIFRVLISGAWGNYADRKSWFSCGISSLLILGAIHFTWGFVTLENYKILVPALNIIGGMAWAGVAISLFTIQFLFAKKEIRTKSIGLNAAIGGITSIIAVKLGGFFIDIMGENTFHIGPNFQITGMQVTFILSGIFISVCALYIHLVLLKEKDHINEH